MLRWVKLEASRLFHCEPKQGQKPPASSVSSSSPSSKASSRVPREPSQAASGGINFHSPTPSRPSPRLPRHPTNTVQCERGKLWRRPPVLVDNQPSARAKRTPHPRLTMASSSTVKTSHYGPINPSILDGFESEEDKRAAEASVAPPVNLPTQTATLSSFFAPRGPRSSASSRTTAADATPASLTVPPVQTTVAFRYEAPNAALLAGFDGDYADVPTVDGGKSQQVEPSPEEFTPSSQPFTGLRSTRLRSRSRGTRATRNVPRSQQTQQPATPSSSTETGLPSNPYSSLIESRQNAMTVDFLRSREDMGSEALPVYPADDFG